MSFSPLVAQHVGEILKEFAHVHFIERKLEEHQWMNKKASVMMQGFGPSPSVGMSATPFYDMGIFGNGQIVGLADSGIDWDNCLFHDVNNLIVKTDSVNMNHRKIVGYNTVLVYTENGVIKTDGRRNTQQTGNPKNWIPPSYHFSVFIPAHEKGARIFSNSWGNSPEDYFSCSYDCKDCVWRDTMDGYRAGQSVTDDTCRALFGSDTCCSVSNQYTSRCHDVDLTLWLYQDSVILFAQGNSGEISSKGNIGSPATSKNAISVGASMTSNDAFKESVYFEDFKNKIRLAKLPFSTPDECCAYSGKDQYFIHSFCCPSKVEEEYTSNPSIYNEFNLAYFSSRGSAVGNRIKPDVTGIGYNVVSAHSDGKTITDQCGTNSPSLGNSAALMTFDGTSVATALVAGAAALLREFFQTKMNLSKPSGPLLKAALVHSSIPMTGTVAYSYDKNRRLKLSNLGSPNSYEGFGRVYLGSLLQNQDGIPLTILIKEKSFKTRSQSLQLCFKRKQELSNFTLFKATLAWYDFPGSIAVVPQLLSDLDLFVNTYVISRGNISTLSVIAGNYGDRVDTTNNVERVVVEELPSSSLKDHSVFVTVAVYVTSLFDENRTKQPFALLMTYPKDMFEEVDPTTDPSCFYTTDFPPKEEPLSDLSDEVIVGIVFAAMLGVLVVGLVVVVYFAVKRRRSPNTAVAVEG
nr:unnamed protein product [Naegleria fowleri]